MQIEKRIRMIKAPFNYQKPNRGFVVIRELGPITVLSHIADAAIAAGYAEEFDPSAPPSEAAISLISDGEMQSEADGEDDLQLEDDEGLDEEE